MKNEFKKKHLHQAVLSTFFPSSATGVACAVSFMPEGFDSLVIYPYYRALTRENQTKSVKVSFREGKNASEVLEFNLWLSRTDVWGRPIFNDPVLQAKRTPPLSDEQNGNDTVIEVSENELHREPSVGSWNPEATFSRTRIFSNVKDSTPPVLVVMPSPSDIIRERTREGYIEVINIPELKFP